jgi:hypothetical protein
MAGLVHAIFFAETPGEKAAMTNTFRLVVFLIAQRTGLSAANGIAGRIWH